MTPSLAEHGGSWPWLSLQASWRSNRARVVLNSSTVETIGAITRSSRPAVARMKARSCSAQEGRAVQTDADAAPAERGVLLLEALHIGQELVAADVEGAEGDRPIARRFENGAVELFLRPESWESGSASMNCSSVREEADRLGPRLGQMRHVDKQPGVHVQADRHAIEADGRHVAQGAILRLLARAHARLFRVGLLDVQQQAQVNIARVAVNDDGVALLDNLQMLGISLTAGKASARATIAIWLAAPASSTTIPRRRARS